MRRNIKNVEYPFISFKNQRKPRQVYNILKTIYIIS